MGVPGGSKRRLRRLGIGAILLGVAAWVGWDATRMPGESFDGPRPEATVQERSLAEWLEADVTTLSTDFGRRDMGDFDTLQACADWIVGQLSEQGWPVERLPYSLEGREPENIQVELRGSELPDEIVVVGAHYDSVAASPGANDNGSGVAAVLALARSFRETAPARTLRFVFFPNRERPWFQTDGMGSLVYARDCQARGEQVVAMISIDSVGYFTDEPGSQKLPDIIAPFYPDAGDFVGVVGDLSSDGLVRRVLAAFREAATLPSEGSSGPGALPGVGWSDHWAFWQCGYPAVLVTDTGLYRDPHYHRFGDRAERLDYDGLARLVTGLEDALWALDS